jgi:holo-[acyl-carrier protein] synthase
VSIQIYSGIDLIEIDRIAEAVTRWGDRFLQRVYTEREIAYCRGKPRRLAGRFAAKEAVSKALGVGIRTLRWRDIEVLPDSLGKPHVFVHGRAAEIAARRKITAFEVSITHSRTDAVVMVIGWGETDA